MRRCIRDSVVLLAIFLGSLLLAATAQAQPQVPVTTEKIRIDGLLEEAAWSTALAMPLPWEWFPTDGGAAVVETTCLLTYDRDYLYIGFRAHDPDPSQIRAHYADRDVPFADDTVGFFLDPFNDERRGFQFRVNPLGVQMDAVNSDLEGSEDWAWDIIWDAASKINADGYTVEIAIPFSQLRFPATTGPQTWGFTAMRDFPRSFRHRMRSLKTDISRGCMICQLEKVQGFENLARGKNLEITPTLTGRIAERRDGYPDGPFETAEEDLDPGISARWGITPNMSLNATINPDFSQVEADAAQLDANTQFALFYPEKRPFFLEGADFFETPYDLYFTRTVADPTGGLKLTGKSGANAFAFSLADDRINNLQLPGSQGSSIVTLDQSVQSAALRWRRDLPGNANVGVLYTGRQGDGYSNHVLGVDGLWRNDGGDSLRGQLAASRSEYPAELGLAEDDELAGEALFLSYRHVDPKWFWRAEYDGRSPEFRADSGFVSQVGVHTANVGLERTWRAATNDRWYSILALYFGADGKREWDGEFNEWGADLVLTYQGKRQSLVELVVAPNQEYFAGTTYHNPRYAFSFNFDPHSSVRVFWNTSWGKTIDYTNAQQAEMISWGPRVELNLGRRLRAELQFDQQEFQVHDQRLFRLNLAQTKLLYHFNRRAYLRAIFQFRDLERDPALYSIPVAAKDQRLLSQLLFSYKVNAQTVFLLGYSDNAVGIDQVDLTQIARTVFLKIGYAWLR